MDARNECGHDGVCGGRVLGGRAAHHLEANVKISAPAALGAFYAAASPRTWGGIQRTCFSVP